MDDCNTKTYWVVRSSDTRFKGRDFQGGGKEMIWRGSMENIYHISHFSCRPIISRSMEEKQTAYERISGENQVYKNVKEMLREVIGQIREFAAADL